MPPWGIAGYWGQTNCVCSKSLNVRGKRLREYTMNEPKVGVGGTESGTVEPDFSKIEGLCVPPGSLSITCPPMTSFWELENLQNPNVHSVWGVCFEIGTQVPRCFQWIV
jgi:hypothetical protein